MNPAISAAETADMHSLPKWLQGWRLALCCLLVLLLTWFGVVLARLPAAWVVEQFALRQQLLPAVQLRSVEGTLWQGRGQLAMPGVLDSFTLQWQLHPLGILWLSPRVSLALQADDLRLSGRLAYDNGPVLRNWQGRIAMPLVARMSGQPGLAEGPAIRLSGIDLAWQQGFTQVAGNIQWAGSDRQTVQLAGNTRALRIGPVEGLLEPTDNRGARIRLTGPAGTPLLASLTFQASGQAHLVLYADAIDYAGQPLGRYQKGDVVFEMKQAVFSGVSPSQQEAQP